MHLNKSSTAHLRAMYKHGQISEAEFLGEIEQRENEQADIQENEREMFSLSPHPHREEIDMDWYRSSEIYR